MSGVQTQRYEPVVLYRARLIVHVSRRTQSFKCNRIASSTMLFDTKDIAPQLEGSAQGLLYWQAEKPIAPPI
jgi:hypothetical protein